jgi:hypothetical protein
MKAGARMIVAAGQCRHDRTPGETAGAKRSGLTSMRGDRFLLWLSTSRIIDGLWVGSIAKEQRELGLRRIEDALALIKQCDSLGYSRITHDLERIWVNLVVVGNACYRRSLQACVLDERYVLSETTTPERLALTIVHEATHARLERCGIEYDEKLRPRIEAACLRRELAFARKLSESTELRDELVDTLEWCVTNPDYYSNLRFDEREVQGGAEALRYLGTPDWIVRAVLKTRPVFISFRHILRRPFVRID